MEDRGAHVGSEASETKLPVVGALVVGTNITQSLHLVSLLYVFS